MNYKTILTMFAKHDPEPMATAVGVFKKLADDRYFTNLILLKAKLAGSCG